MPEADETIVTKFVVDIGEAINKTKQLRADIDKTKADLLNLSKETKQSFAVTAEVLKRTFKEGLMTRSINEFGEISKETLKQITTQVTEYNKVVSLALQELSRDVTIISNQNKQNALNQAEADKMARQAVKEKIAAQKEYVEAVTRGKKVISEAAREEGRNLENLARKVREISRQTGRNYQQVVQGLVTGGKLDVQTGNNLLSLLSKGQPAARGFSDALGGLFIVVRRLLGVLTLYQVVRNIGDYFRDAATSAYEFQKSLFALEAGLKVMQRSGINITMEDVLGNLDKLEKKFGIFSRKELVQGSASLMNLVRDFGLTKEQIFQLQDAIATLAVINGRSMDDVQRTVALALSSGYTEGLQRLGVSINRVTIAQEAARLGYSKNYMSLTELQRAQATYNLIIQKTAKYEEDLTKYQEEAPGQIDKLKVEFTDLTTQLGDIFLPVLGSLAEYATMLVVGFQKLLTILEEVRKLILGFAIIKIPFLGDLLGVNIEDTEEKEIKQEMQRRMRVAKGIIEKNNEEIAALADELGLELVEIESEWNERRNEAWERYEEEKADIASRYSRKLEDIARQLQQKLVDLDAEYARKRTDAYRDYQNNLVDIDEWYQRAVQDAHEKYRQQQIDEEKDFQREMERLRMRFLFDLESALQERNARAILNLIRKYNFDREEAKKDYEERKQDNQKAFQRELADLKKQLAEKRAQAKLDYERRLEDLNIAKQREYEAIQLWHQRELEDAKLWLERELEEARINYEQRLADADKYLQKQLELIAKRMAQQALLQHGYLEVFRKDLLNYIGPEGVMTKLWEAYYNYINNLSKQVTPTPPPSIPPPLNPYAPIPKFAEGGAMLATRPTLALFGERGAELATFTPVSKLGSTSGKVVVAVTLSPELEGRIINNALDEFANIAVEVYKESVI